MQPILVKRKIAVSNSRTDRKSGLNPFHVCPYCSYQNSIKSRTLNHMTSCKMMRDNDKRSNIGDQKDQIIKAGLSENIPIEINQIAMNGVVAERPMFEDRIQVLEKEVQRMKQTIKCGERSEPNVYDMASQIYRMSSSAIQGVLISKISEALNNSLKSREDIESKKFEIVSSIIGRFQQMDFSGLINTFAEKLQRYYQNVRRDIEGRDLTRSVRLQYERAYKFFSQFQEIDMVLQVKIISKILSVNTYQKRFLLQFYSRMIKDHPKLFPYDPLPKYLRAKSSSYHRQPSQPVSLQAVKDLVESLIDVSPELATDLWMVVVMGLRKFDTMRIFFKIPKTRTFAGYIRIIQKKNNHSCVRVVPESLMKLITISSTQYPITKERYKLVQNYAIRVFGRFYSLRSVCLTTIFTAFFHSDALAQTHRNIHVPMKHYINYQSRSLIDNAFTLGKLPDQQFNAAEEILLDFSAEGNEPLTQNYKSKKVQLFGMEKQVIVNELREIEEEDNILFTDSSQKNTEGLSIKQQFDAVLKKVKREILIRYGEMVTQMAFHNIEQAIMVFFPFEGSSSSFSLSTQIQDSNNVSFMCLNLMEYHDCRVKLIKVSSRQNDLQFTQKVISNGQHQLIVVQISQKEFGCYFLPCQDSFTFTKSNQALEPVLQNESKPTQAKHKLIVSLPEPVCQNCKKGIMISIPCKFYNHLASVCTKCEVAAHRCTNNQTYQQKTLSKRNVTIIPTNFQQIQKLFIPLELKRSKNNIKQVVSEKGYKFISDTLYFEGIPDLFYCQYPPLSIQSSNNILENRLHQEYLPLSIKPSLIPDSGLGVFCTTDIPKNALICSYLGQIGLGSNVIYKNQGKKNDSIYLLGHIGQETLNIAPHGSCNVGRFINHAKKKNCNCSPHISLLQYEENMYQICLYITSTKNIKAGEELLYFYGKEYKFDDIMSEEEHP